MAEAVERAYSAIRAGISAGDLQGGAHLRAGDLAERLGISRTPVREALRRLHAEGLVDFVANHGAYVTTWTREDANEVFGLRARLESYAAELAAAALTEPEIAELEALTDEMARFARNRTDHALQRIGDANSRFHRAIIAAAANRRLAAMIATVVESQIVLRTFRHYSDEAMGRSIAHHRELIAAFRARDASWAAAVMHSHVRAAHHAFLASENTPNPHPTGEEAKALSPRERVG